MIGELRPDAIDAMVRAQGVAHLACVLPDGLPYVVPISYAYDGAAFYSYTADGMKLAALRANPRVCLSVGDVVDAANWSSAIAWGTFAELHGEDAVDALQRISRRMHTTAVADRAAEPAERTYVGRVGADGVVYRIAIERITGRYSRFD